MRIALIVEVFFTKHGIDTSKFEVIYVPFNNFSVVSDCFPGLNHGCSKQSYEPKKKQQQKKKQKKNKKQKKKQEQEF